MLSVVSTAIIIMQVSTLFVVRKQFLIRITDWERNKNNNNSIVLMTSFVFVSFILIFDHAAEEIHKVHIRSMNDPHWFAVNLQEIVFKSM